MEIHRQKAKAELEMFSALVEQSPSSIIITDYDGIIQDVNARFVELTGYTKEDSIGKNPRFLQSGTTPVAVYEDMWKTILSGKRWFGELCNRKKNGELFWEDTFIYGLYSEHDGKKELTRFIGIKNDLTMSKQKDKELRESEESYRYQFQKNSAIMLLVDHENGMIIGANDAALAFYGYGKEEMLSFHITKINTASFEDIQKAVASLSYKHGELLYFTHRLSDGGLRDVKIQASLVQFGGRQVRHVIVNDITESKKTREDLHKTLERLQKSQIGLIDVISKIVEMRDPYTSAHQKSVSALARKIAQRMGLDAAYVEEIRKAALIHDIGKIDIPAEILCKPTQLEKPEIDLIKRHAQLGFNALVESGLSETIKQAVLQHHERLDGSGYPQGLLGENITLGAKILAVADVIDAMSSHRPYRASRGIDTALIEIVENKGVRYDPDVVEACFKIVVEEKNIFLLQKKDNIDRITL